jgi:hypothetical protein
MPLIIGQVFINAETGIPQLRWVMIIDRDVPDPDTGIRYPVNLDIRHYPVSGINLPDIYRIVL